MSRDFITDVTSAGIAKSLDGLATRHKVIANNIANVETPGFKRSDVSFEDQLKQAMEQGSPDSVRQRIDEIEAQTTEDTTSPSRPDGNNVSMDKEMAYMVKNNMNYDALVQLLNLKGSMVRAAIKGG